jgi:hypothetical protein
LCPRCHLRACVRARARALLRRRQRTRANDDPVFAAGRRRAKGYRNALRALAQAVAEAKIPVAPDERLSLHSLRHTYTSHLIVGLELDAATTSKLAGHANPNVTMRVYADDFRKSTERNAAVLARAAEKGFGTRPKPDQRPDQALARRRRRQLLDDKSPALAGLLLRADDGTRTHDLLHGKGNSRPDTT